MSRLIFQHETLAKTITYCLMHFVVAITVAYVLSGNWAVALSIGIIEPLVQTGFFSLHERKWNSARANYRRRLMDGGLAQPQKSSTLVTHDQGFNDFNDVKNRHNVTYERQVYSLLLPELG